MNPADTIDKKAFYEAVQITCDAIILWAHRHSEKAKKLAKVEQNPKRKEELLEIARITRKVPEYPAETFYEALQFRMDEWISIYGLIMKKMYKQEL